MAGRGEAGVLSGSHRHGRALAEGAVEQKPLSGRFGELNVCSEPGMVPCRSTGRMATIEQYLHNLYRVQPDFVYSVSRDFAKSCQTPMLVLPDDIVAHPLQVSIDIASLAPNAEITVFPWKEPPELKACTINRGRTFLKRHQTA
jgi:hypothetical protein